MTCDVGKATKVWRMSCDVDEVTERLENEQSYIQWSRAHSPTLPSLYLRHSSFSNPSVASPTSQLILQLFFRFSYVTSSSHNSPGEPPMGCKGPYMCNHDTRPHSAIFTLGKPRCSFCRKLSEPQDQSEHEGVKKYFQPSSTRDRIWAVQP